MGEAAGVRIGARAVLIDWADGTSLRLPSLWLRDNCPCDECRVAQTSEKRFIVSDVPADLSPLGAELGDDELRCYWPDGHESSFTRAMLTGAPRPALPAWQAWRDGFEPARVAWAAFLDDANEAVAALRRLLVDGVIVLEGAPPRPGALEALAPRLGPLRELLFARIHDVEVDAGGYNVAHTSLPLPPHNDFASYTWPPSVQALHMLVNEVRGGRSIVVDGFALLESLRAEHPRHFETLLRTPVPFREFDADTETYAVASLVRCGADGRVAGLRFSNQLMQAVDPAAPGVEEFYLAYHELCRRVMGAAHRVSFRLAGGEVLVVAAHRVLHGREGFEPGGRRHLQNAYFELDNVANALTIMERGGV